MHKHPEKPRENKSQHPQGLVRVKEQLLLLRTQHSSYSGGGIVQDIGHFARVFKNLAQ